MKLSVFTALALVSVGAPVPSINVNCQAAGGYYGTIRALQTGSDVVVTVTSGIKFRPEKFLRDLRVNLSSNATVSHLSVRLPSSACERAKDNEVVFTCVAQNVPLTYSLEEGKAPTVVLSALTVEFAEVHTTIVHGELSQIKASVVGVREVESDQFATAKMMQKFQTPDGAIHSSCRAI